MLFCRGVIKVRLCPLWTATIIMALILVFKNVASIVMFLRVYGSWQLFSFSNFSRHAIAALSSSCFSMQLDYNGQLEAMIHNSLTLTSVLALGFIFN
jgi:hypothetical protein